MSTSVAEVELCYPALYCAAGSDWPGLWQALQAPARPEPWVLDGQGAALPLRAHAVPALSLAAYGIDRKLARTMEKQAQLCMVGAATALQQWPACSPETLERTGLYLGLPSVDEEVPPLSALQRRDEGDAGSWLSIMLGETPPFSGLSLLNSSACAHISGTFGLRGAMAALSPSCDAGLQALIEGVLSVAEGENDRALIGAVAPKLHPLLPAQLAYAGWSPQTDAAPGEGAAFVTAGAPQRTPGALRLTGYARGFLRPGAANTAAGFARLFDQALSAAGRALGDIGWILPAACLGPARAQLEQALAVLFDQPARGLPMARVEQAIGLLGPAEPLVHLGLAAAGLGAGHRLVWNAARGAHDEQPLLPPVVMLLAWSPLGQCAVALLERGES
jgi:3-oxoacyl-[acyl-carrier-protein] synthase II